MRSSNDNVEECYDETREDDVGINRTAFSCDLQHVYENPRNQKKVLFLLCLGLCLSETEDSPLLLLYENKPWSRLPKTEMRPVNVDFAKEIVRRGRLLRIHPTPRPLNWPKAQKIEWLETNPVQDGIDISFLRGKVSRIKGILERLLAEEQQQLELVGLGGIGVSRGGNWHGSVPYLRFIVCLTQDDIKFALLLRRADAQSRQELDGQNSENR
jgi:hypothetical protein